MSASLAPRPIGWANGKLMRETGTFASVSKRDAFFDTPLYAASPVGQADATAVIATLREALEEVRATFLLDGQIGEIVEHALDEAAAYGAREAV